MPPEPGAAPRIDLVATDYVVGPDAQGFWLAVETHGRGGGIFVDADSALHFAQSETARRPGAVHLAPGPLRLGFT